MSLLLCFLPGLTVDNIDKSQFITETSPSECPGRITSNLSTASFNSPEMPFVVVVVVVVVAVVWRETS